MSKTVFLSHNHLDKPFVRKLANDLENHGIKCWLDEAEMKIGDSLIQKIREGIDNSDYFAIILSPHSVNAPWVKNELDVAYNFQIGEKIKVLPLLLKDCEPPGFLVGKLYADFRKEEEYLNSFKKLLATLGITFNKNIFFPIENTKTLKSSIDKAIYSNLPLFSAPFHRPFQYIGMSIQNAEKYVNAKANGVGNIVIESDECRMLLEAEGNFISYVEIEIKRTQPHFQNMEFDSEPLLGTLSIGLAEVDLVREQTHCHTFYDHKRKLKIAVSCLYDGGPLSVSFGSKYYGM